MNSEDIIHNIEGFLLSKIKETNEKIESLKRNPKAPFDLCFEAGKNLAYIEAYHKLNIDLNTRSKELNDFPQ